jgi:hypothetical protein
MSALRSWTTLDRRVEFSAGPIREIARETVLLPDGRVIDDFYTARMGDYALVYAVTGEGGVLVLRQYKTVSDASASPFPEATWHQAWIQP